MADFPAIKPTTRRIKMGQFPKKVYRSMNGTTATRSFGNTAFGWGLELTFKNTSEANAVAIWDHYISQAGGTIRFLLPLLLFSGSGSTFTNKIITLANIQWDYNEPPDIDQPFNLLYDVSVSLSGDLVYG